jgi:peptide methionine sulfoxide reductase MsrB
MSQVNSSRLVALQGRAHGDVDWATVDSHLAHVFDANPHIV